MKQWLQERQLSEASSALKKAGASRVEDLKFVKEDDLKGLKPVQKRKLMEALEQWKTQSTLQQQSGAVETYFYSRIQ